MRIHPGWQLTALGAGALCAGALALAWTVHDQRTATETKARVPAPQRQPTPLPAPALTSPEQQVFVTLDPGGKEAVTTFLARTPGPLDNYLLKLEGMVNLANARYGTPDREDWQQALPVAQVLEQGMCDCAQRNWLNQFIATGEAGLAGDLTAYHQQGETMAGIGRHNGDPVVSR